MNDASKQPRYRAAMRRSLMAWVALLVLLGLSAFGARFPLGLGNLLLSLGIATVKVAIVGWVFMGLRERRPLLRIVAAVGLFALLVLCTLSLADLWVRQDDAARWQQPQALSAPKLHAQSYKSVRGPSPASADDIRGRPDRRAARGPGPNQSVIQLMGPAN
ncbi:MAG TPA: cytochrome C oxidase subunit IV family protein [Burkholderiaceae bacterium]|jgi:caa(3)-type oxidase subunit IV